MDLKHLLSLYIAELEAQDADGQDEPPGKNAELSGQLNRFFQFVEKAQSQATQASLPLDGERTAFHSASHGIKPTPTMAPEAAPTVDQEESSTTGATHIGHYKLIQKIAEGGMGAVWLAEQQKPIRRRVALKLIKAGRDNDQVIARFDAERQALAMMEHPHIAKMLDAGQTSDGLPFFVMELVQGLPITVYCDRHRLSLQERLHLFIPVCQAIQHAHQKGIIHRDLKPSNILVTQHDSQAIAKVIDFGLAKAVQHQTRLTDKTMFTEYGQVVGTLQYMSPEQAELNSLDIDTRTDIYSLGVLLYELLTGSTPLEQKSLINASIFQVLEQIRTKEPPRPSARLTDSGDNLVEIGQQRRIMPDKLHHILRGDLDWVVMKALDKDRTRRYESASALAEDIERYLLNEPIVARPPSAIYLARKFISKHRMAVFGTACILALLVLGLAGTALGLSRALVAQAREATARGVAETNLERALQAEIAERQRSEQLKKRSEELEKLTQFQQNQIQSIDASKMGRDIRDALLRDYAQLLQTTTADNNRPTVDLPLFQQSVQRLNFTDIATASLRTNIFAPALETINKQYADQPVFQAKMLLTLSRAMRYKGIMEPAAIDECLAIRQRLFGAQAAETLEARLEYANLLSDQGKLQQSRELYQDILDTCRSQLGNDHPLTHDAIGGLASAHHNLGNYSEAEILRRENLKLRLAIHSPESPEVVKSMSGLANTLSTQKQEDKLAEAEQLHRQVLAREKAVNGPTSEEFLTAKIHLGRVLYERNKYDESLQMEEEVVAGLRALLGELHPTTLMAVNNLAASYYVLKRPEQALAIYQDLLSKSRDTIGDEHPQTLITASNTALCLKSLGRYEECESLYLATIALQRQTLGPRHPQLLKSIYEMGALYFKQDKFEQATPWLHEYIQATQDHDAGCLLIRSLLKQKRLAEAIEISSLLREYAKASAPNDPHGLAVKLGELAQEFYLQNAVDSAGSLLKEAQQLFQQTNDLTSDAASDVQTMLQDLNN